MSFCGSTVFGTILVISLFSCGVGAKVEVDKSCGKLSVCMRQNNCINTAQAAGDIWDDLIVKKWNFKIDRIYAQINFDCVMIKCSRQCVACTECGYVKDSLVQGISTTFDLYSKLLLEELYYKDDEPRDYHACPKMQECVHTCVPDVTVFQANLNFLPKCLVGPKFGFAGNNCALYGYNGDCPALFGLTKKLFIHLCYHHNIHILSNNPSCEELWNKVNLYKHSDLEVKFHDTYPMNITEKV